MICFHKIYGFHALNHQIIEKSRDVTDTDRHTDSGQISILFEQNTQ